MCVFSCVCTCACVCMFVFKRVECKAHVHPRQRVRLRKLENARLLLGWQKALLQLSVTTPVASVGPFGLPRLEVVVDLVRVHGSLGEHPTTTLKTLLLCATLRNAALAHGVAAVRGRHRWLPLLQLVLLPALVLVDHGHFQYNCLPLGLTLWSALFIDDRPYLASLLFTLALHAKQTAKPKDVDQEALAALEEKVAAAAKANAEEDDEEAEAEEAAEAEAEEEEEAAEVLRHGALPGSYDRGRCLTLTLTLTLTL